MYHRSTSNDRYQPYQRIGSFNGNRGFQNSIGRGRGVRGGYQNYFGINNVNNQNPVGRVEVCAYCFRGLKLSSTSTT